MTNLNFDFGTYAGLKGDVVPMIEMTHPSGALLRFFGRVRGDMVGTVWIRADQVSREFACAYTERNLVAAEKLFEAAISKGYVVTTNRAGA